MSNLTAPTLVSATPALNTSAVGTAADIVLTFSEAMAAGTGLITISDGVTQTYLGKDGALHTRLVGATDTRTVSITDTSQVTISGNTVTINLASDLQPGKSYSVQMGKGVLLDTAGNAYAGLADSARLHFTTSSVAIPAATVDSNFSMTDTGSSSTDFITSSAAQTVSGKYTGTLATGDFVEVSLDNGAHWITATTSAADHTWSASGTIAASSTIVARVSNAVNGHSTAAHHAFTYDTAAPTVSQIELSNDALATGETPTVTVTFSEAVTGLTVSDFTVTGGALSNLFSSEDGKTWTATLTPSGDSGGSVQLKASSVADIAGNSGPASPASAAFTYAGAPTVTIATASMTDTGASNSDFITNSTAQSLSGTLSAALASNEKVQVSLDGGNTWTDAVTSGTSWSLAGQTISASNTLVVRVSNGTDHGTEYSHDYTLDRSVPTATVTLSDSDLKKGETAVITVKFSEAVSGLTSDSFKSNDTISTPLSTDGGITWTATLTPTNNGNNTVILYAASVTDKAGNTGPAAEVQSTYMYDATPTVTIVTAGMTDTGSSSSDFITNSTSQALSGTISAALSSGEKVQVSLDNGSTWTDAATSGTSWSLAGQTITSSNTLKVRVSNGTLSGAEYSHAYTLDQAAPTAAVTLDDSSLTTGQTATVTVKFSEVVSGLTSSDFTVTGGSIGTPSSSDGGTTWTATLTPSADGGGSVQLNTSTVTDTAGNSGPSSPSSASFTYDSTPTATIATAQFSSDTGDSSTDFITTNSTQTISGTLSATLSSGEYVEVSLDNGGTWTAATTNGTSWSLARQTISDSSTLMVRVTNGSSHGTAYSHTYTLDQSAPTVSSFSLDDTTLGGDQTGTLTVVFNEKVAGLTSADFTVSGGTLGAMSSSDGITWTGSLTPTESGRITFSANSVTDVAGNGGPATAPSSLSYSYDNTAPTATLSLNDSKLTTGETATLTVTLSEAVTDTPTASDFTVSGGSLGTFTSNDGGTTWTATLTPTSSAAGAGSVTLSAGSISDTYGNAGPASAVQLSFDYDTQTPALTAGSIALSSDTGAYSGDFITQTSSQTVSGSFSGTVYSATGAKIEVSANNGETWTTATVDNTTHTWSASETLSGSSTLKVRLTDSTGATSTQSHSYTIDSTAPGSLASITPVLSSASDTGNGGSGTTSDHITDSGTPTVKVYVANLSSSSFPAGDFIDILDTSNGNALVGTHTITSSEIGSYGGYVEVELSSSLSEGAHTLVARARDLAGNTGTQSSEALAITVDQTVASMASHSVDLAAASDLGQSSIDNITSDATPTVTVNVANTSNLQAGDILQIYDTTNSVVVGSHTLTATDFSSSGSDISITLTAQNDGESHLADGVHALALRVYDKAGNIGTQSTTTTSVTIDTVAPTLSSSSPSSEASNIAVSSGITLTFSEDMDVHSNASFELSNDFSQSDVRTFDFESLAGNVASYDDSTHSITLTPASSLLTDGSYTLTFTGGTLTDVAGNIFQEEGTSFLSFSTVAGEIVVVDPIATPDPVTLALSETTYASHTGTDSDRYTSSTLSVTDITESHLKYSVNGGSSWTVVDVSGTSASITLPDGTYSAGDILVKQYSSTDYVSSAAQLSQSWTIDRTAPTAYISTSELPDFVGGSPDSLSGLIGGTLTTDTENVEYTINGGTSWIAASSTTASDWSIDSVTVSSGGEIGLRVTDAAGNVGDTIYIGGSEAGTHSATGSKTLYTQGGADTITVSGTGNTVYAGGGNDTIVLSNTNNTIDGGADTDTVKFNTSASLSSLVGKATNIEKLYVSSGNTLTIANGMTKADLTAMGFDTVTPLLTTYAVVKVDGDSTGHLSLGTNFTQYSSLSDLVLGLTSSLTSGYYTYVDSTDSVIVLVGTSFIAS